MAQATARGGRKTVTAAPWAGVAIGASTRTDVDVNSAAVSDEGITANDAPMEQRQSGQSSGHASEGPQSSCPGFASWSVATCSPSACWLESSKGCSSHGQDALLQPFETAANGVAPRTPAGPKHTATTNR